MTKNKQWQECRWLEKPLGSCVFYCGKNNKILCEMEECDD